MSGEGLRVNQLQAGYGRVRVVTDVSFEVAPGETVALVGRNGAGKTTSLAAVAGLRYGPCGGTIHVGDREITGARPLDVVQAGISLVPEGRRVFRDMTVSENLRLGAYTQRSDRRGLMENLDRVFELFEALQLYRSKRVGELSGGQQQMVAIGQALMSNPRFMLLDEPTSGLAPALVDEMYDRFKVLVDGGIGMVVVDQNIERVLDWSHRYYLVDDGKIPLSGPSEPAAIDDINAVVLGAAGSA